MVNNSLRRLLLVHQQRVVELRKPPLQHVFRELSFTVVHKSACVGSLLKERGAVTVILQDWQCCDYNVPASNFPQRFTYSQKRRAQRAEGPHIFHVEGHIRV